MFVPFHNHLEFLHSVQNKQHVFIVKADDVIHSTHGGWGQKQHLNYHGVREDPFTNDRREVTTVIFYEDIMTN